MRSNTGEGTGGIDLFTESVMLPRSQWQLCCCLIALTFCALLLHGCGTAEVREVNKAALSLRTSYSDEKSRHLALKSFDALKDRATDYRVGPEDVLTVSVFEWQIRNETRSIDVRVTEEGAVSLPILGDVKVAGLTTEQVRVAIETMLRDRKVLQTPRVSVEVKDFRSRRVAVVGAVRDPGVYSLRQNVSTLIEVLSLAGGLSERSGQVIYVIRSPSPTLSAGVAPGVGKQGEPAAAERQVITIDLFDLMETGDMQLNVVVQPGDVVNVPEAMKFFVVGFINEPGGFSLNRPTTILEAIALCKGVREREASPSYCMLKRRTAEGELLIPVDLVAIARGEHPNMYLSANDILDVRQTTAKRWWLDTMDVVKSVFSISIGYSLNSK
jgi:polysaccharide export outer membrane protein